MSRFASGRKSSRSFTVVGGGQGGLMLAIGLRQAGHQVRLVQDRTADEIAAGRVLSSQCMFGTGLAIERRLALDPGADAAPPIVAVEVKSYRGPTGPVGLAFTGRLSRPALSVDQRLKFPRWLRLFEELGGELVIDTADVDAVERYARDSDLVIVATGKGGLSRLFPIDRRWSPFDAPLRALSMVYLRSNRIRSGASVIRSTAFADHGGIMQFDAATHGGRCEILLFEGAIGGWLDLGPNELGIDDRWSLMHAALDRLLPHESARLASAVPTDIGAGLGGRITPVVRRAFACLPSGRRVMGLGDAIVLNDPLIGQGANNAAKMASLMLEAILQHGDLAFDDWWCETVAKALWRRVRASTIWSNMNLAPSQEAAALAQRASCDQRVADLFANGFDEPSTILDALVSRAAA